MSSEAALRHNAFVYESDDEYVARSAEFLKDGLEAGEGCIVADTRHGLAMMRDALGPDAERVAFIDVSSTYTRPAHAVATYYGAFLEQLRRAPSVRSVADVQVGPAPREWREWAGYEAITNVAYSHLPVWVLCAYDANGLPDPIVDAVWRTHPQVLSDGWHASDRFEDPRALLREFTPEPEPLPELRSFSAGEDLERFRELLARALVAEHVPEAKVLDMLVAGTEVAANAVRHGAGIEEVRVGRVEGRFVCEVVDRGGGFDDPMAGYLVPRDGTGSGLWVARHLAWRVESFRAPRGFTVRIWL
ncbi:MAG TPA: sensor histidine kinase [Solirubrobacteraceae bacterium]|nr:sensor histidine kinase [Solirubrobacteraceae bacterium]